MAARVARAAQKQEEQAARIARVQLFEYRIVEAMPSHCACATVTNPPPTHSADTTTKNPKRRMMPARVNCGCVRGWCYVKRVCAGKE
jgi:hypothetical protein